MLAIARAASATDRAYGCASSGRFAREGHATRRAWPRRPDPHRRGAARFNDGASYPDHPSDRLPSGLTASGISSKTAPSTSIVRQGVSPQTEQQRLLPTLAASHSSTGLPAIQMRFDSAGLFLNDLSSISRSSRIGSMFNGLSTSLSFATALCRC